MEIDAMMKKTLMVLAVSAGAAMFFGHAPKADAAVIYCQYINYPAGCVARPGVRLVARPIARPVARVVTPGIGRVGVPGNRGGPVNRRGRY
jgi:hypothetical protein